MGTWRRLYLLNRGWEVCGLIFYHSDLQGGKFIAVASFKDGDRIVYNLDAGESRLRPAMVAACRDQAKAIADLKGESYEP